MLFDESGWYTGPAFPEEAVAECSGSGEQENNCLYWVRKLEFVVPRELAIKWLREFGAWTPEEMAEWDDERLAKVVFWLACCESAEREFDEGGGDWLGLVH